MEFQLDFRLEIQNSLRFRSLRTAQNASRQTTSFVLYSIFQVQSSFHFLQVPIPIWCISQLISARVSPHLKSRSPASNALLILVSQDIEHEGLNIELAYSLRRLQVGLEGTKTPRGEIVL
jgi:hypothetical protein